MSGLKEKVEKLDQSVSKIEEKIRKMLEESKKREDWGNLRIMKGDFTQLLVTTTPDGGLMIRFCGQRPRNCVRITRARQLEEFLEMVAVVGNADKFVEMLKKLLSEINGDFRTEALDIW